MAKKNFDTKADYKHFLNIATRWHDNDIYGHVNNVVYYSYFDTVVNRFMIDKAGLDIHKALVIGVVVETMCSYRKSIAFPAEITAGLRVGHLGKSSVRHEIGLFNQEEDLAIAVGYFVHAFVNRETNKPTAIPEQIRSALSSLKI